MNLLLLLSFLPLFLSSSFLPIKRPNSKCLALCLEGGGDSGAWEAGVLSGLVNSLPPEDVQYDVVSGISVGAINGLYISTFAKGDEKNMIQSLKERWTQLSRDQVFEPWNENWLNIAQAIYNRPSLLDNDPLRKSLEEYLKDKTVKRKLTVGVTDATNVEMLNFDLDTLEKDEIRERVVQSASMPAVFPYQVASDNTTILIDGGVLFNIDIHSAVRRCRELGFSDSDIVLDAILPTGANIERIFANKSHTGYDLYQRYKKILAYKGALDDIMHAIHDFPDIQFRYIVFPLEEIPSFTVPIFFDQKSIEKMIAIGEKDGKAIVQNPNLINLNELNWRKNKRKPGKKENNVAID